AVVPVAIRIRRVVSRGRRRRVGIRRVVGLVVVVVVAAVIVAVMMHRRGRGLRRVGGVGAERQRGRRFGGTGGGERAGNDEGSGAGDASDVHVELSFAPC